MSSIYEGFSMVIVEAMTCGLPVVSFACPSGPIELVSNERNGFLVKEGGIRELADKLLYLINHPNERKKMGAEAFAYSENFSEERIMSRWISLFEAL